MLLTNYDFYDLHALLIYFRYDPARFPDYLIPIRQIVNYFNSPIVNGINYNQIRKLVSPYFHEQDEALSWVLVNNKYTANIRIIKNESYYFILSTIFEELLAVYPDVQQFYLLCDAAHNIPLLLVDETKPLPIIKTMIKTYRKQYNPSFLVNELKK